MKGAGANGHIHRLENDASLLTPELLQYSDDFLKSHAVSTRKARDYGLKSILLKSRGKAPPLRIEQAGDFTKTTGTGTLWIFFFGSSVISAKKGRQRPQDDWQALAAHAVNMPFAARFALARITAYGNAPSVFGAGPVLFRNPQAVQVGLAAQANIGAVINNLQVLGQLGKEVINGDEGATQGLAAGFLALQSVLQLQQKR
jgi:hypothetical protein